MKRTLELTITIFSVLLISCQNQEKENIDSLTEKKICENIYLDSTNINEYTAETFINKKIQLVTKQALTKSLKENNADYGFAIVMETNTGQIKALVNLEKDNDTNYNFSKKWLINKVIEPGGLIKTFDLMSILEDQKADTSTIFDGKGGVINYFGKKIHDSHLGNKILSLGQAYTLASNTIFSQVIYNAYEKNPNVYLNNMKKYGFISNLDIPINDTNNSIPKNLITDLPWLAIGYKINVSPIQILTFYNAIANNGIMIKPLFLSQIKFKSKTIKKYSTTIMNKAICSKSSLNKIQTLLRNVVTQGTGKNLQSNNIEISGKSATIEINLNQRVYGSAFVGYFPTRKPKYTVFVYVYNPKAMFYGSTVAGSVLKEIALSEVY